MSVAKKARHLPVSPFDQCPAELIRNVIRFLGWVNADELRYTDRRCCLLLSDFVNHSIFYAPRCSNMAAKYACAVIPCISRTGQHMRIRWLHDFETAAVDQVYVQSVNTAVVLLWFRVDPTMLPWDTAPPAVNWMNVEDLEDFNNCMYAGYDQLGQFSCRKDAEEKVRDLFTADKAEQSDCSSSGESESDSNSSDPLSCAFECYHQRDMLSKRALTAIWNSVVKWD
jgi:hypothetical protein